MKKLFFFLLLFPVFASQAQIDTTVLVIGRTTGTQYFPDGNYATIFGFIYDIIYPVEIPGPTLTFTEGDSVEIDFWNFSQGAPHTIHLHGLDVNQENDGVPMLSFVVNHMEHGYYKFKAPHPGLYLYHCHVLSPLHVQAGMYGMIVIEPASGLNEAWLGGPQYDKAFNFLFSEFDMEWHVDSVMTQHHNPGQIQQWAYLPKYEPEYYLVNGVSSAGEINQGSTISTQANARNLLRFANVGFKAVSLKFPSAINAELISTDGRPLNLQNIDSLLIMPGERYSLIASSNLQLKDSIRVGYIDMNTLQEEWVHHIPFEAAGFFGLDNLGLINAQIVPNPARNEQLLKLDEVLNHSSTLTIYNLEGKEVFSSEIAEGVKEIALPRLPSGMYMLSLRDEQKLLFTGSLIRQ